jgi:hypothetical protein
MKNNYTLFEQVLHRLSVGNTLFNEISFDLEKSLYLAKTSYLNPKIIFISGLARSGTTALLNHLVNAGIGHSLTYQDLPFLFMPNLSARWKGIPKTTEPKERAHGDNILINEDSPEAIDEIFWKTQTANKYIQDKKLSIHTLTENDLIAYKNFIQLHLGKSNKTTYLTKNNNTILRLNSLVNQSTLDNHFLFAIREPFSHACSLHKQHVQFSRLHKNDAFSQHYFNSLGHHEFGLNLKSFDLQNEYLNLELNSLNPMNLDYWLVTWLNYYQYLWANISDKFLLVDFTDLCAQPNEVMKTIQQHWGLNAPELEIKPYSAPAYPSSAESHSADLLSTCQAQYLKLKALCLVSPSSE